MVFDVATRQSLEEVSLLVRPEQLLAPAEVLTKLGVTQEQLFAACMLLPDFSPVPHICRSDDFFEWSELITSCPSLHIVWGRPAALSSCRDTITSCQRFFFTS